MEAEIEGRNKEAVLTLYPETATEEFACWKFVEFYATAINVDVDDVVKIKPAICINISRLDPL